MGGYNVTFDSVFEGTLCGQWPDTGVWLCLLAMRDHRGYIDKTPEFIAAVTGIPLQILEQCIARFLAPDTRSRTKGEEGRRLRLIDPDKPWGWAVINHTAYGEKARLIAKNRREVDTGQNAGRMHDRRPPPETAANRREPPPTPSLNSQLSTLNSQPPTEEIGGEGDARGNPSPPAPAKDAKGRPKSKRLPKDFDIEPWRIWTANNCPWVNFDTEIALLRDHQFRDAHSDWPAVIRKWMRTEYKRLTERTRPTAQRTNTREQIFAALDALPPAPGDEP